MSEENVEPVLNGVSTDLNSNEFRKLQEQYDRRLLEAVNAATPPATRSTSNLPTLPETIVTGFKNGVQTPVSVVNVDGLWLEKYTAYDFILMRKAAKKIGVTLRINSAFRTNEEQARIYNERYTNGVLNATGRRKGKAAKPGYSNHQEGISLDIHVGMTVDDAQNGAHTPAYVWLKANANQYGFINDVSSEPWHWTHRERRLVGIPEEESTFANLINSASLAPTAVNNERTKLSVYLNRERYDSASAAQRSLDMSQTSRAGIYASLGERAVWDGASSANFLANISQAEAAASRTRNSFEPSSLSPLEYDFDTGVWGDSQAV